MHGKAPFSIQLKLILSYLPLIVFMFLITGYSLLKLHKANAVSRHIAENDMVAVELTSGMTGDLLAQEAFARRYLILSSREMLSLFWERRNGFATGLEKLQALQDQQILSTGRLEALHDGLTTSYVRLFAGKFSDPEADLTELDQEVKAQLDQLITTLRDIASSIRRHQREMLMETEKDGQKAIVATLFLLAAAISMGAIAAHMITRGMIRNIHDLKRSALEIAQGRFNAIPGVKSRDEIGDLSAAFGEMARRLAQLEQMSLDANPLTRLPGGRAIENVLTRRIAFGEPLTLCVIDLDNFKAYNDRYGYSRGNEVIQKTAGIIQNAVATHGEKSDFIGHIGGDDFTVITAPRCRMPVCRAIVAAFDAEIPAFYDTEEREAGCIISTSRRGETLRFPIMTISIALVTHEPQMGLSHMHLTEIAAELKAHAKSIEGSIIVENRRSVRPDEAGEPAPALSSGGEHVPPA